MQKRMEVLEITAYEYFSTVFKIKNEELLKEISSCAVQKTLYKGEKIIHEGQVQNYIWLMERGCARGFYISPKGVDITDCIIFQSGSSVMGHNRLNINQKSIITIECIEDSKFFLIPISDIKKMYIKYVEIKDMYIFFLISAMEEHWKLKRVITQFSALERYQWFLQEYPELINKVPQKYIASFLGITPVTLSRVRKNNNIKRCTN